MVQVIHEVIDTPFQVAMDCRHVPDNSDHICWNCTIKIIDMADAAEARAAQLEADLATARADIVRYQDERVTLLGRLETMAAELKAQRDSDDRFSRDLSEALNSGDGVYRP